MNDREALADLVHRYSDAVCRKDHQAWAATWAEDSQWDLGRGRTSSGKADIVELWERAIEHINVVVQLVHNGTVAIDGDTATGRWYISEHLERANGAPGMLMAWYDDTYVKIDGEWLFSSRTLAALYHGAPDLSAGFTKRE